MIKPYYEKQNAAAEAKENQENLAMEEKKAEGEREEEEEKKPEYVFINGKLVKRSQIASDDEEQVFEDRI